MTLQQLRKEIGELKNSIIYGTQPQVKVFVFNIGGLTTTEGLTVAEVESYAKEHPYTKILRLQLANFRKNRYDGSKTKTGYRRTKKDYEN